MQNARLGKFHAACLAGVVVVMAGEVQDAVNHEMGEVMRWAAPGGCGFPADYPKRQHNLRCGFNVGQHVGRLVATAMARIEAAHRAVSGKHDGGTGAAPPSRPHGPRGRQPPRRVAPAGAMPAPPRSR